MKVIIFIGCAILVYGFGYVEAGSVKISINRGRPIHFNCYAYLPGNNNVEQLEEGDLSSGSKTVQWNDNKELVRCNVTDSKDNNKLARFQVFDKLGKNGHTITAIRVAKNRIVTMGNGVRKGTTVRKTMNW